MTLSPRTWRLGGIAAAVLLLVASWFLLISPTLQEAAALDVETAGQDLASEQLRSRISLLKKQSEELPAQEAVLAEIQQRMPPTAALPTLIRNLTTVATEANVKVASVTPGRPTPIEQPAPVGAEDGTESSSSGDAGSTDSETSQDSSTSAAAPAAATGPQVQAVSLNISACGTFAQLRNYLREIESMKRVAAVSSVSIAKGSCTEGSAEDDLTATIAANVFTLPNATPDSTEPSADSTKATEGDPNE